MTTPPAPAQAATPRAVPPAPAHADRLEALAAAVTALARHVSGTATDSAALAAFGLTETQVQALTGKPAY